MANTHKLFKQHDVQKIIRAALAEGRKVTGVSFTVTVALAEREPIDSVELSALFSDPVINERHAHSIGAAEKFQR